MINSKEEKDNMSLTKILETEISIEKHILEKCSDAKRPENTIICKMVRGKPRFLIGKKNDRRQKYIRLSDYEILDNLLKDSIDFETAKALRNNIDTMQKMLKRIQDYDTDSILNKMKPAYRKLRDVLYENDFRKVQKVGVIPSDAWISKAVGKSSVLQSENTKDRKGLKHRTSFDLMVRSKNEMLIAEGVYASGLEFRYEKRLELVTENCDGYNTDPLYPDFTIKLKDGSLVYWEHLGMMDKPEYQKDNYERLKMYLANGIYPPKNLILTFDGENMPFDNSAIWRIIEGLLI